MADDRQTEPRDLSPRRELPAAMIAHTVDGRAVFANETFARQQGVPLDEITSMAPYFWTVDAGATIPGLIERIIEEGHVTFDTRAPKDGPGSGPWRIESWSAQLGSETIIVSVRRDMHREQQTQQALEFRSMLLDHVSDAVICHTLDGRVVYVNEAACRERGYTRDEFLGLRLEEFITTSSIERSQATTERILRDGGAVFESEDVAKDGHVIPVEVHARVATVDGTPVIVSVVRDVSERRHAQAEIEKLAYYDTLTGLPNRRLFMDRLDMALAHARRSGELLAVVFVDIDHLKRVNDQLGHSAGDRLLLLVGERLGGLVRAGDTVARISGDEFVVLLPGVAHAPDAELIVRKLLTALRQPFEIHGTRVTATVSMGVALNDEPGMTDAQLLANADDAMYSVKSTTRNDYAVYSKEMSVSKSPNYDLQAEIQDALQGDQLVVYYQPQIRLSDGQVECVEALVRWHHPSCGIVEPGEFLAAAEETGLIVAIDEFVLRQACWQHAAWLQQGLPRVRMAVNVSMRMVSRPGFDIFLAGLLGEYGVPPDFLELEVAEQDAVRAENGGRRMLELLHSGGIRVAIDGFARGYAAPNHVHGLPVDVLKINRGCATDDAVGEAVAAATLGLADALSLETVVECIETPEQIESLRERTDLRAQGYAFVRPCPPDELVDILKNGYALSD